MKILKNMEIIFTVTASLACAVSYVSFLETAPVSAVGAAMPVVVVTAKRLTPQEKALASAQARVARDAAPGERDRTL